MIQDQQTEDGRAAEPVRTLEAALTAIGPELAAIGQRLREALPARDTWQAALVAGYKGAIWLVDKHRGALVHDVSGNLRPDAWRAIRKSCPGFHQTTFSRAWQVFKRAPDAFAACRSVRQFSKVGRNSAAPDKAEVQAKVMAVLRMAFVAGVDEPTVVGWVRDVARKTGIRLVRPPSGAVA